MIIDWTRSWNIRRGKLVAQGTYEILKCDSLTAKYLNGEEKSLFLKKA
jgi:hypothetical protein